MAERLTWILIRTLSIAVFAGTFPYGYNIAVVNAPAEIIQEFFFSDAQDPDSPPLNQDNDVNVTTHGDVWNESTSTPIPNSTTNSTETTNSGLELSSSELFLWSFTVAIFTVGGMAGSLLVGTLVKRFGRKGTLLLMNVLAISGGIMMGCSKVANSITLIIIPRFLLGVYSGLGTGVVPMYIGEIAPKRIRGAVVALFQLLITLGLLGAQVLSLTEILGTEELWPLLLALTAVPSILELFVLPFSPESPRCLLIDRKQEEKAKIALKKFRGTDDIDVEIEEMKREAAAESSISQQSVLEICRDKSLRWQIITVFVVHAGQQLCGINAIFFYLNSILENAGVPKEAQNYASVGVGTVNVIMTIISIATVERLGRKGLLAVGYGLLSFWCVMMTIALSLQDQVSWMPKFSIACVIGFIIGFAIGPGPVAWILTTEMFQQTARPAAFTIGCVLNWTSAFLLALIFPFMQRAMRQYVFLFFLVVGVICTAYVIIIIPETKNKSFQEISKMFAKRNGVAYDAGKESAEGEELMELTKPTEAD